MYKLLLKNCAGLIVLGVLCSLCAMEEKPAEEKAARSPLVIDIEKLRVWPDSQSDIASAQETVGAAAKDGGSWDNTEHCAVLAELRDDIARGRILVFNKDATLGILEGLIVSGGIVQASDERTQQLLDELLSLSNCWIN